jgi:SAM-dependent methyltransferase
MNYLTKDKYFELTKKYKCINWDHAEQRWRYHKKAVDMLIKMKPNTILEAGSLGIKLCEQSETIDYSESGWESFYTPTYDHDLKELPWPVKTYDVFVALRVFHHLTDKPHEYLDEMKRISKQAMIAVDEKAYKIYRNALKPDIEIKLGGTIILYYGFHKKILG